MAEQLRLAGFDGVPTLDVHDLILPEGALAKPPAKAAAKPAPRFEVAFASGADWAARRVEGERSSVLVLMVTQGQYYVRDERTGRVRAATGSTLKTFARGAGWDSDAALTPPWLASPISDLTAKECENLMTVLADPSLRELTKRGMLRIERLSLQRTLRPWMSEDWEGALRDRAALRAAWKAASEAHGEQAAARCLARHLLGCRRGGETDVFCGLGHAAALAERLSNDTMREVVRAVVEHERGLGSASSALMLVFDACTEIAAQGEVDQRAFVRQVRSLAERSEAAEANLFLPWREALRRQRMCLGTIEQRYPQDPQGVLDELWRIEMTHRYDACDPAVRRRAEALADREWSDGTHMVIAPRSCADIAEEGNAMHNCICTFIDAYARGACEIYFVRSCADPSEPLVDVEVRQGSLRQAFQSRNRPLTDEQRSFVAAWCAEKGIRIPRLRGLRPLGA